MVVIFSVLATSSADPITAHYRANVFDARGFAPAPVLSTAQTTRFAVIGDYGYGFYDGTNEAAVAGMVASWNPDFIITTGDNNYPSGEEATIDANIGQYYKNYIYPYTGSFTPTVTITQNLFFPSLGNHDWVAPGATPYLNYFMLPGNERYYDFVWGPVHLFALDSDSNEPDGIAQNSSQATWLERHLAYSPDYWNIVYFHHAPYSSGPHGSNTTLQWPFQSWGAASVLAGHDHDYERIVKNGFPYYVNGLGGRSIYTFTNPFISGSMFHFDSTYGAMLVTANDATINFSFYAITDTLNAIDTYTLTTKPTINRAYLPLVNK